MTKATSTDHPSARGAPRASGEVASASGHGPERPATTPPHRFGFHRISTTLFGRLLREPVPRLSDGDLYRTRPPGEAAPAGDGGAAEATGMVLPLRSRVPPVALAVALAVVVCLGGVWLVGLEPAGPREPTPQVDVASAQEPGGDRSSPARDEKAAAPVVVGVEPEPPPELPAPPSSSKPLRPPPVGKKERPSQGKPTGPEPSAPSSAPSAPEPPTPAPPAPSAATPDVGWFPD